MLKYIQGVHKLLAVALIMLVINLTACGDPSDDRLFSLADLKLGMQTSEGLKYQPMGLLKIWVGSYKNGTQRVIYEAVDGTIWKVFHAINDPETSQKENKQLVIDEFGKPDEEKTVKGRKDEALSLIYKGDQADKTAILTVTVQENAVSWDLVSKDIRQAVIEQRKEKQAVAQARCQELLDRPLNELSVNERMEAMGCATKPWLDRMGQ